MLEKVEFELVSPEEILLTQPVDMVVVPGGEGYYGVLVGHIPMITNLKPGTIAIYEDERVVDRWFVTGGFAEVTQERCTVLVDSVLSVKSLDRAEVEQEIKNLDEDYQDADSEEERDQIMLKQRLAAAKLEAIVEAAEAGRGH